MAYYETGDIIRFNKDIAQNKIKNGNYYKVGEINSKNRAKNTIPLIDENGRTYLLPLKNLPNYKSTTAGLERYIEIYQTKTIEVKEGDSLLWLRNFKKENIRNGERVNLIAINEKTLKFKVDNGKEIELDKNHPALKHIDYGYVLTNHKVQGKDSLYGIGLLESYRKYSATLNNFYVQISRAILGITLVTDSKEKLTQALYKNSGIKDAALDFISSNTLTRHNARFENISKIPIHHVIAPKMEKEFLQNNGKLAREFNMNAQNSKNLERTKELEI